MLKEHTNTPRLPDVDGGDRNGDMDQRLKNMCPHEATFATEAWWIRALEDELGLGSVANHDWRCGLGSVANHGWRCGLSATERRTWHQHLAVCDVCRAEWEALMQVESILYDAPAPPPLSADFTARTLQRLAWRQRLQFGLTWLGGLVMVSFVTLLVLSAFGSLLSQANQCFIVLRAGWDVLLDGMIHLTTGFLIAGQKVLPVALTLAGILLLLMMPNGILATYAFVLVKQGRQRPSLGEI